MDSDDDNEEINLIDEFITQSIRRD
ncbi:unnamed protein product, partial [Rotaria sp. Silwood2]